MPNDPSQLDPSIIALMHGLKQNEGGSNYNAMGDKNAAGEYTAAGIGQWSNQPNGKPMGLQSGQIPSNFAADAQTHGLNPTDFSPENQNKVMYSVLAAGKQSGLAPEQILSKWNSGRPNAYLTNPVEGSSVSATGTQDVAAYVKRGMTAAQQYAQKNKQSGYGYVTPPNIPPTQAGPQIPAASPQTSQNPSMSQIMGGSGLVGGAEDVAGSLLPFVPDVINDIQGKNDKSALQQLGDAGMSALWFLPFGDIAEGIGAGAKVLGAGEKLAGVASTLGTGLATGYAGDVSSNLAQGNTGAGALTPGLGTALGGGLSAAALGGGALYNHFLGQQNALNKITGVWMDAAGATKAGIKNMSKTEAAGLQANPEFLASAGITPEVTEQNGRLVFNTGENSQAYQTLNSRISALGELRDAALDKGPTVDLGGGTTMHYNPPTVNFEDLRQQMLDQAKQDFSGTAMQSAQDQINREMDALKADPKYAINSDGEMSATQTSKIKTYLQGRANLDRPTQGLSAQIYDTMQNGAKKAVENAAEASGNPNIKEINKIMQQHYDAQKFLTKIDGQTIKGGRLGTYVKEGIGSAVGIGAASTLGGGVLGSAVGAYGGYKAGELASKISQRLAAGGPFTAGTIGRMSREDPPVVQQMLQYLGRQGKNDIAPIVKATQSSAGQKVTSALKMTPGNVFRGMSRRRNAFGAPVQ